MDRKKKNMSKVVKREFSAVSTFFVIFGVFFLKKSASGYFPASDKWL